jgi:hypothetical protein
LSENYKSMIAFGGVVNLNDSCSPGSSSKKLKKKKVVKAFDYDRLLRKKEKPKKHSYVKQKLKSAKPKSKSSNKSIVKRLAERPKNGRPFKIPPKNIE